MKNLQDENHDGLSTNLSDVTNNLKFNKNQSLYKSLFKSKSYATTTTIDIFG